MTFDEQLKRSFDALSDRLRTEIGRQLQIVTDEVAAAAVAERDRAAAAQAERNRVAAEAERDRAAGEAERDRAAAESERNLAVADARRNASLEVAGQMEIAVAGARQEGYADGLAAGRAQAEAEHVEAERNMVPSVPTAERPAEDGATERLADAVRAIGRARSLTEILDTLVARVAQESGRTGVWLVRGASLRHWRSTGFDEPVGDVALASATALGEAARSNAAAPDQDGVAVPIAMSGEVVAVLLAANPANRDVIEVLTRYAARCLEALTAFKAARALTERPGGPAVETTAMGGEGPAEEDASARRYARLLVSEIKLYHGAAVVEGRRDRDLGARLGGEIARARVLYEQRVPPHVRQRADYFHDELVQTLADGDATLLQLT